VVKALAAGSASAGGFIVPPEYSTDIIELLTAKTAVRRLNARTVPMNGTVSVPKLASGGTAAYTGENANITPSEQTFAMLVLTAKTLAALVPISNSLLRWSSPAADSIVRDDLVTQMSVREDLAFIRGDGLSNTPRGIRYWTAAANVFATAGTSLANITTDLGAAILRLENANIPMTTPGWMMAPRTWNSLMTIRDSNGNYAWRDEMLQGRLWGHPFVYTTQIPTNLGGGAESELYLVDFAQAVIGESTDLVIDASSEAAYYDGSAVVAAFSKDQTVIRAIAQHDFGMRHDLGAAVVTGVAY
jgi:HK97 family phage major capsid protein